MCMYARIELPATANSVITRNDTSTPCRAARLRASRDLRPTSPRNTGTVPGGSMITSSVIEASMKSRTLNTGTPPYPTRILPPVALSARASSISGAVVSAPSRTVLLVPW